MVQQPTTNHQQKGGDMSKTSLMRRNDFLPSVFNTYLKPFNEWFELPDEGDMWGNVLNVPAVNIKEDEQSFQVNMAAPGMKKEDFQVTLEDNMLTISSEKKEEKEQKEEKFTRKEFNYSSFSRSFTLPQDVQPDKIDARYENGMLQLVIPKKESVKKAVPKHISVN
jgi:HSP20 family protein